MWIKTKSSGSKDTDEQKDTQGGLNVDEEYLCAIRTESYAEFFLKAKSLVRGLSFSSSYADHKFSEILLEPVQESIPMMLESVATLSKKPDLKGLILGFFDLSAEASGFCSYILKSIDQIRMDYQFIQEVFEFIYESYKPDRADLITSGLNSFINQTNPFSSPSKVDFQSIHDRLSSVLHTLKLNRTKVCRKIKIITCIRKATVVCVTATIGLIATSAIIIAAHSLIALAIGPAIFCFPIKRIKQKLKNFAVLKITKSLTRVQQQLDVAAKGIYILKRDFDTISRIVDRVRNEIEHERTMIKLCLMRREDTIATQVMNEVKKSSVGLRKQVQDLEEHVYLCLVTINRARRLVIKETTSSI